MWSLQLNMSVKTFVKKKDTLKFTMFWILIGSLASQKKQMYISSCSLSISHPEVINIVVGPAPTKPQKPVYKIWTLPF